MEQQHIVAIDDILAAFKNFDGSYQRDRVAAAIERREEIIPRLIEILWELIVDPDQFLADEDRYDHIYAVMLLGHLKAVAAHHAVIEVSRRKNRR